MALLLKTIEQDYDLAFIEYEEDPKDGANIAKVV